MLRVVVIVLAMAGFALPALAEPDTPALTVGSYGRVTLGTDMHGGTPEPIAVVAHGSRIVEPSYLELDLYHDAPSSKQLRWRAVATVALAGELFHYVGEPRTEIFLRNLYVETTFADHTTAWIGSRMVRGRDLYLLDYWPLDDLNLVGAGAGLKTERLDLQVHAGANRLRAGYQWQEVDVPAPVDGAQTIAMLDRQRFLAAIAPTYHWLEREGGPALFATLRFEVAAIASGERRREDQSAEKLPADFGWSVGAHTTLERFRGEQNHLDLFARYARGLSAFDELAEPLGVDTNRRVYPGASELVLGLGGAHACGSFGAQLASYARRFVDADAEYYDRDDGWEYIVDLRPYVAVVPQLHVAVDLSYQRRVPRGLSPSTITALEPAILQVAPMVILSPRGQAVYARPHLRFFYRAGHLNRGARDLYPAEDHRRSRTWVHFLGVQAEWWVRSSRRGGNP